MTTKVYKAYFLKSLSIDLPNGKTIVFRGGIYADSMAKYTTDNPEIQKMLEKSRAFNDTFYLESVQTVEDKPTGTPVQPVKEEKVAEPEKPLTDVKDIKRFRNLVEMRAYMAEIGLPVKDDSNYMECKAIASKEGYDFQIKR